MKKILFPTDFLPHAPEAFQFALSLADAFGAKILMMHVFGMPSHPKQNPDYEEGAALVADKLLAFKEQHQPTAFAQVQTSFMAEIGFPAETILEAAEDEEVDLIVMGSHGKTNGIERYFGGITSVVINNAKCPVLLIPPSAKIDGWKHFGCTTNFSFDDLFVLNTLQKWGKKFNTELTCTHVLEEESVDSSQNKVDLLKEIFNGNPSIRFQIKSGNVKEVIQTFIQEYRIGLLGMTHHHKGFLAQLKHSDLTKGVASEISVPMLVFNQP